MNLLENVNCQTAELRAKVLENLNKPVMIAALQMLFHFMKEQTNPNKDIVQEVHRVLKELNAPDPTAV